MKTTLLFYILMFVQPLFSQERVRIAFWNVENLFDTINAPAAADNEFTPTGRYRWNSEKYSAKTANIRRIITELNPAAMGVCEIENSSVIEDILPKGFRYVHYDSPDVRGIDVALIYNPEVVEISASEPIKANSRSRTRDILSVDAIIGKESYTIFVVHLPSRRGNDPQAQQDRLKINHQLDSLTSTLSRVIVCGDFNQNPNKNLLPKLYNASQESYDRGRGSYAYRDEWQMYDQFFVSNALRTEVKIYTKGVIQPNGRFKGYPHRGVFSDHLLVFIELGH